MNLTITRATPAAAELFSTLHDSTFEDHWNAKFIESLLRSPGVAGFVAWSGDAPVAFAMIRTAAQEAELLALGVAPEAQGRGVGRALLLHACQAAESAGAEAMHLEVAVTNTSAQTLYKSAGFEVTGRRVKYYASGEDALVLTRRISESVVSE